MSVIPWYKDQNIKKWHYLLIAALIMVSKDTVFFGTNENNMIAIIHYAIVVFVLFCLFFYTYLKRQLKIERSVFVATFVLIVFSVLTFIFSSAEDPLKYGYECILYLMALFFVINIPYDLFKKVYIDVMSFLSIISLVFFILHYIFPSVLSFAPTVTNEIGHKFHFWGLCAVPYDIGYVSFRNYSVFREPGVYQIFLNIALLFCYFTDDTGRFVKYLFILTIFTTFSTTGYICCFFIVLYSLFSKNRKDSVKVRDKIIDWVCRILLIILIIIMNINLFPNIETSIFGKLFTSNDSFNSRYMSVLTNLYIFFQNVFFGKGFQYVETNFKFISSDLLVYTNNNTNTLFKLLAVHGAFSFIIVFSGMCSFIKRHFEKKYFFVFLCVLILLLSSEDMIFNVFTYILVLYGYVGNQRNIRINIFPLKKAISNDENIVSTAR